MHRCVRFRVVVPEGLNVAVGVLEESPLRLISSLLADFVARSVGRNVGALPREVPQCQESQWLWVEQLPPAMTSACLQGLINRWGCC